MMAKQKYRPKRYYPGYWNGLQGWRYCAQYFNINSEDRVTAMMEVASALRSHGIKYTITRWKDYCRVMIAKNDYLAMSDRLKERITNINIKYLKDW